MQLSKDEIKNLTKYNMKQAFRQRIFESAQNKSKTKNYFENKTEPWEPKKEQNT